MASYSDEELQRLSVSAEPLLKMYAAKERVILDKMYGAFKNGEKDFLAMMGEYSVLRELIVELKTAMRGLQAEETKQKK